MFKLLILFLSIISSVGNFLITDENRYINRSYIVYIEHNNDCYYVYLLNLYYYKNPICKCNNYKSYMDLYNSLNQ
jgi:hypothetical protein